MTTMRVINRTAITVVGAQPYTDWTRTRDAEFPPPRPDASEDQALSISVPHTRSYGSAFLLPEFEQEEDLLEWVEENYTWLFEFQLSAWTEDELAWPKVRDLKMFREWFRIDIHSVVVDVGDDEIDGEEL
jgi:hypothetical protein